MGRTYIYSGELDNCEKYFKSSQYLGKKLGIFEGYLSSRSRLEALQRKEIDNHIREGNYKLAKEKLEISISVARELVEDDKEYIIWHC